MISVNCDETTQTNFSSHVNRLRKRVGPSQAARFLRKQESKMHFVDIRVLVKHAADTLEVEAMTDEELDRMIKRLSAKQS